MPAGGLIVGSVAAPVLGGLLGNLFSSGDRDQANQLDQQAADAIKGVSTPQLAALKAILAKYNVAGTLTPQMEQTFNLGPSAMEQVKSDPRLVQQQMGTINQLLDASKGMTPQLQQQLMQAKIQADTNANARNKAVLQPTANARNRRARSFSCCHASQ